MYIIILRIKSEIVITKQLFKYVFINTFDKHKYIATAFLLFSDRNL
jgi:hypothetical protein